MQILQSKSVMIRSLWSSRVGLGVKDVACVGVTPVCAQAQSGPTLEPRGGRFVFNVVLSVLFVEQVLDFGSFPSA